MTEQFRWTATGLTMIEEQLQRIADALEKLISMGEESRNCDDAREENQKDILVSQEY